MLKMILTRMAQNMAIPIKSSAYKKRCTHYISKLIQRAHVKTIHTLFFIRNLESLCYFLWSIRFKQKKWGTILTVESPLIYS